MKETDGFISSFLRPREKSSMCRGIDHPQLVWFGLVWFWEYGYLGGFGFRGVVCFVCFVVVLRYSPFGRVSHYVPDELVSHSRLPSVS